MSSDALDKSVSAEICEEVKRAVAEGSKRAEDFQAWLDKRASQIRVRDSSGIACYFADLLVNSNDLESHVRAVIGLVLKHHVQKWYARMNKESRQLLLEILSKGFQVDDIKVLRVVCIIVCALASDAPPAAAAAPRLDVGIGTWEATGVPVIARYVEAFRATLTTVQTSKPAGAADVARLNLFVRSLCWLIEDAAAAMDEPTASQLIELVCSTLQVADFDRALIRFRKPGTRRQSMAMAGQPAALPDSEAAGAASQPDPSAPPAGDGGAGVSGDGDIRSAELVADAAAVATCAVLSHPVAFAPGSSLLTALVAAGPTIVARIISLLRNGGSYSDATKADLLRAAACSCISQPIVRVVGGATPVLVDVAVGILNGVSVENDAGGDDGDGGSGGAVGPLFQVGTAVQSQSDGSLKSASGQLPSIGRASSTSRADGAAGGTGGVPVRRVSVSLGGESGGEKRVMRLKCPATIMAAARLIAVIPTLEEGMAALASRADSVANALLVAVEVLPAEELNWRLGDAAALQPVPLHLLRYHALRARDEGCGAVADEESMADQEDVAWRVDDELYAGATTLHWADGAGEGRDTVGAAILRAVASLSGQMAGVYVALLWPGVVAAVTKYALRDLSGRSKDVDSLVKVLVVATAVARASALIPAFYEKDVAAVANVASDLLARTAIHYRVVVAAADFIAAAAPGVVRAPFSANGSLSRRASCAASPASSAPASPAGRVEGVRGGALVHSLLRALSRVQVNEAHVSVCHALECLLDSASALDPKGPSAAVQEDEMSPSPHPPSVAGGSNGTPLTATASGGGSLDAGASPVGGALPAVRTGSAGGVRGGVSAAANESAETYTATHNVRELLKNLLQEIIAARPNDPVRFLRDILNTRIEEASALAQRTVPGAPVAEHILRKIQTVAESVASSIVGLPSLSADDAAGASAGTTATRMVLAHCRLVEALADAAREELDSSEVGGKLVLRLVDLWASTPMHSSLVLPIAASLRSVVQNAPHLIEPHADLIADRCVMALLETCPEVEDDDDEDTVYSPGTEGPDSPRSFAGSSHSPGAQSRAMSTGEQLDGEMEEANTHRKPLKVCALTPVAADRVASCLDLLSGLATQCAEAFPPIAATHNVIQAVERVTAYASKGLRGKLVPDPLPRRVLQGVLGLVADMIRASPHMMTPAVNQYLYLAMFCAPMPHAGLQLNSAYLIGEAATKCPTAFVGQSEFDGPAGAVLVNALERCNDNAAATGIAVALGRVASVTPTAVTSRMHPDAMSLWAGLIGQMMDISEKTESCLGMIRAFSSYSKAQSNRTLVPTLVHAVASFQRPPRAVVAALHHLAKSTPNVQQQFADVNDEIASAAVRLGVVNLNGLNQ